MSNNFSTSITQTLYDVSTPNEAVELLREIEAWLSFNTEPSKKELKSLKESISKFVSHQDRILAIITSY